MTDRKAASWARAIPYGTSEETSVVLDRASHGDFQDWNLEECKLISTWPADARMSCFDLDGLRQPDDVVPNHLGLFIVSNRLRDCLIQGGAADFVQLLPVRLDYRGEDVGEFYVLNPLAALAALDFDASEYSKFSSIDAAHQLAGQFKTIARGVLRGAALAQAPPIFRLAENLRWVIVSPELRARILRAGITGIWFKDLEIRFPVSG